MTLADLIEKFDRMQRNAKALGETTITLERLSDKTDDQFQERAKKLVRERALERNWMELLLSLLQLRRRDLQF
jgi:hypothetical protein